MQCATSNLFEDAIAAIANDVRVWQLDLSFPLLPI